MPSPEQGSHHKQEGNQEQERTPYYRAASFKPEESAGNASFKAQDVVHKDPDCDLSTYRFQLNRIYHVAVLGDQPSPDLDQNLQAILSSGESVPLPPDALKLLKAHGLSATAAPARTFNYLSLLGPRQNFRVPAVDYSPSLSTIISSGYSIYGQVL